MRFMLFVCPDESPSLSAEQRAEIPAAVGAWGADLDERGIRVGASALAPGGECSARITGFNIVECADEEEARAIAAAHPVNAFGTVEVRAFA